MPISGSSMESGWERVGQRKPGDVEVVGSLAFGIETMTVSWVCSGRSSGLSRRKRPFSYMAGTRYFIFIPLGGILPLFYRIPCCKARGTDSVELASR